MEERLGTRAKGWRRTQRSAKTRQKKPAPEFSDAGWKGISLVSGGAAFLEVFFDDAAVEKVNAAIGEC